MRPGVSFTLTSGDRHRFETVVPDPKSPQKHVWRARIVLLSDDGLGRMAIMRETGKAKNSVWRWQDRFYRRTVWTDFCGTRRARRARRLRLLSRWRRSSG